MSRCALLGDEPDVRATCVLCRWDVWDWHFDRLDDFYLLADGRCFTLQECKPPCLDVINLTSIAHKRRILHEQANQD